MNWLIPGWLPSCFLTFFSHFLTQCSSSCGYGQKSRDIWCVDLSRRKVSDALCNPSSKPENDSSCHETNCPPKWKHGDWSAVSHKGLCHLILRRGWARANVLFKPRWCEKGCNWARWTLGITWNCHGNSCVFKNTSADAIFNHQSTPDFLIR